MSAIHDLIAQIGDPRLRERLAADWANAAKKKKFGLMFEDHLPELLPLHGAKPRKGDLVCRRQGALFGRIQLIRKQSSACGEHFVRPKINQAAMIKKLLLIASNPPLDELFASAAT